MSEMLLSCVSHDSIVCNVGVMLSCLLCVVGHCSLYLTIRMISWGD